MRSRAGWAPRAVAAALVVGAPLASLRAGAQVAGPDPAQVLPADTLPPPPSTAPRPTTAPSGKATTSTTQPPPPRAWIAVDVDTGAVYSANTERTPMPPASLTKVLTALAVSATTAATEPIPISPRAEAQPANKVGAKAGQAWDADTAMHVLLLQSANDLAMAFAEKVGGSAEGFQGVLARTAAAIGMQDSPRFNDPAGLDDEASVDGGNLVSARDLAIAARTLLDDPWLAPIVATGHYRFTAPDGVVHDAANHNKLVSQDKYAGAIGVKTGFTKKARHTYIGAARRDGRTMLVVVLGAPDPYGAATRLLDQGFATSVDAERGLPVLPPVRHPTAAQVLPPPAGAPPSTQVLTDPEGVAVKAAPTAATTSATRPSGGGTPLGPPLGAGLAGALGLAFVGRRAQVRRRVRARSAPPTRAHDRTYDRLM